jgi:hypothetical protein
LDGAHVGARFQQVDREAMAKAVGRDRFGNAAASVGLLAGVLDGHPSDGTASSIPREEPALGPGRAPPGAQDVQQLRREHHVAVFLPLCVGEIYVAVVSQLPAIKAFSRYWLHISFALPVADIPWF